MIYFDAAATTFQKPPEVRRAIVRALEQCASPGRGGYAQARAADRLVYDTRVTAAKLFSCEPEQVVFTMNATHGLNIAVKSLVGPGQRAVISGFEHNAVLRPLHAVGAKIVVAGRSLFDPQAVLSEFDRAVTRDTAAVIVTHVSNVFGFILPVAEIAGLCRARGVPFVLDASQSAGTLPVSMRALGARFIAMPGHKGLYGPQGTGLLICAEPGRTLLEGGTGSRSRLRTMPQELPERHEAGTANVCGIAGLRAGMSFVLDSGEGAFLRHELAVRARLAGRLQRQPGVMCFGTEAGMYGGVLSFRFRALDCEDAAELLAERGIAVRAGLHCAPLAHESAGTLETGTVRAGISVFNTVREADVLADAVEELCRMTGEQRD